METASADSMPEGVERQGIGTPATRAATIEKLVQKGFLERKGTKKTKVLLPTDKGKALITVMPEEIQSPEMTADWETKLLQIGQGTHRGIHVVVDDARIGIHRRLQNVEIGRASCRERV